MAWRWLAGVMAAWLWAVHGLAASDGSFENGKPGETPPGWVFSAKDGVDAEMLASDTEAAAGRLSLRIVNRTRLKPQFFASLAGSFPAKPGERYRLSVRARGVEAKGISLVVGRRWRPRLRLDGLRPEWRTYLVDFAPTRDDLAPDGTLPVRIITEDLAKEAHLDEVRLAPLAADDVSAEALGAWLPDGGFEVTPEGEIPLGWDFGIKGPADVSARAVRGDAYAGSQFLRIANHTSKRPNQYGVLQCRPALEPGKTYRAVWFARGDEVENLQLVLGAKWKRHAMYAPPERWRVYWHDFTVAPEDLDKQKRFPFRLLSETRAVACDLDELRLFEGPGEIVGREDWARRRTRIVSPAGAPVEAVFRLPVGPHRYQGREYPGPETFRAELRLERAGGDLRFVLRVVDADPGRPDAGKSLWHGDSLQLRFSPGLARDRVDDDLELVFGLPDPEGRVEARHAEGYALLAPEAAAVSGRRTADGYEISGVLRRSLFGERFDFGRGFSFNALVNNRRADGGRDIAFLAPGIHETKSAFANTLLLFGDGKPQLFAPAERERFDDTIEGVVYGAGLAHGQPWTLTGELRSGDRVVKTVKYEGLAPVAPDQAVELYFREDASDVPEGTFTLTFREPSGAAAVFPGVKVDMKREQADRLRAVRRRWEAVEAARAREPVPSAALEAHAEVVGWKTADQLAKLEQGGAPEDIDYHTRVGRWLVPELEDAMAAYEALWADRDNLPPVWRYRSGPAAGYVQGMERHRLAAESGEEKDGAPFWTGYGHFSHVVKDLERIARLGGNFVQIEMGPKDVFPRPGKEAEFDNPSRKRFEEYIEPAMAKALAGNVKICLLLSPHYDPPWWLDAHPEVKGQSGFMRYDIGHPASRAMVAAYLDAYIPWLRDSPYAAALHSLCITNEPVYMGARLDRPLNRRLFAEWIDRRYGSLDAFNQTAGTAFPDHDALCAAGLDHPAVRYAFRIHQRETLNDFHAGMAERIRKHWPGIRLSSKIMANRTLRASEVSFGVEPELFSEWSDYNGNDNHMLYRRGGWASGWDEMALTHDLQRSFKTAPIVNSENHVVRDGDLRPIPYAHFYTATFQQYLQGVGGIATWVWRDVSPDTARRAPHNVGNVYQRPAALLGQSMAAFDASRLPGKILAFADARPRVGFLYSPASLIMDGAAYEDTLRRAYAALSFCGRPIGFRSERQLERGEWASFQTLLLPSTRHMRPETVKALEAFRQQGGRVVALGTPPERDPYGRPLARKPEGFETRSADLSPTEWMEAMADIADAAQPLPLALRVVHPEATGVLWRMVPHEGGWLVNIVNYNLEPRALRLTGAAGTLTDLIAGREASREMELPPLRPLFLEFRPD